MSENTFDIPRDVHILVVMPNIAHQSTAEAVAALCGGLEPAHQTSLLEFAQFLKWREAQAALDVVDEEDEAAWDREFSDPARVANFARWADQSLTREKPQPIDPARL